MVGVEEVVIEVDVDDVDDATSSTVPDVDGATAAGRAPTWLSARLTICHVSPVVTVRATSQPTTSFHKLMSPIVSAPSLPLVNGFSRFPQVRPGSLWRRYSPDVARIVLVEDDVEIRRLVAKALAADGHDIESADRGLAGLELAVKGKADLVILDLGLPDVDGAELLSMIRAVSEVPVIVITARGADDVVVATLDAGADDYLVKPFSVSQLEARVRAVMRRNEADHQIDTLKVGDLVVDVRARAAALNGRSLDLSPKEFDLLRLLVQRSGEVMSKRELLAEVWREPYGGSDHTIDVHLSWLRKKLGETASNPRYIQTVHGVGVKLVDPTR